MRRSSYKKYILVVILLIALVSFPFFLTHRLRVGIIALFTPSWKGTHLVFSSPGKHAALQNECKRLEGENHLLRVEIGKLKTLIDQQSFLEIFQKEQENYQALGKEQRVKELNYLLDTFAKAVPARVIYRDPSSWTSSFWIGVGEETNRRLGTSVIEKNSPVILGRSVVGAIDYVGKKQSRVRLLTDLGLKPSVRAVRGYPQNAALVEHVEAVLRSLKGRGDFIAGEEILLTIRTLEQLVKELSADVQGWYLAKGLVQGMGTPLWRSGGNHLRGIGFNYDFPDEEGPSRDLQTGKPLASETSFPSLPLIQVNDLLVTTGMDGVFPAGLRIGEVIKLFPLREGAYTYEIEALPSFGNLDEVQTVFVIPSLGFEPQDQQK